MVNKYFSWKKLQQSFRRAGNGLKLAFCQEHTFRVFCFLAIVVFSLMIIFRVSGIEALMLILVVGIMLSLELLNSQIEKVLNIIHPQASSKVWEIKDMSSAAILIAAVSSAILGLFLFLSLVEKLFT